MSYRPTHGWCPSCNEQSAIDRLQRCLWCGAETLVYVTLRSDRHADYVRRHGRMSPNLSDRQVRAAHRLYLAGWSQRAIAERIWRQHGFPSMGACMSAIQIAFERGRLPKRDRMLALRKVTDAIAERARELYEENRSMAEVAELLFGSTPHRKIERLEEALRREFRRRGWETRSTAETLSGRACRTDKKCAAVNNRGRPCGANVIKRADGTYADYCWQHDESYAERRDAIVHLERMRASRRWMAELVPMAPFVAWLKRRRDELALPPDRRRFADRDESLSRLSEATGIDSSTLIKWMRFQNSKQEPKYAITESKVREVLEHDGTTTFEDVYEPEAIAA